MGYGQLRKNSTISKKLTPTQDFQQNSSIETVSAVIPKVTSKPDVNDREIKRRKSSQHRRSIYSIDFEFDPEVLQPEDTKPTAPDGGYGWVVVVAVHLIEAMSMGFLTSLGIFYIEWMKYFDSTAAQAGLVVSMSSVVLGVISPLCLGIAQVVGIRPLVMLGGFVTFIGLLATSYANSIVELIFTVGVLTAFGYGMISSPSVIAHVDYFDKKFAVANGIAFAGVSLGQLIFPPLTVEFINWFGGWRGAIFVISALMLNICVFGALLRPLKNKSPKKNKTSKTNPTFFQSYGHDEYDQNNNKNNSGSQGCINHHDREIVIKQSPSVENYKFKDALGSVEDTDDSVFIEVVEEDGPITFTIEHAETYLNENTPCSSTDNQKCVGKSHNDEGEIIYSSQRKRKVAIVDQPILTLIINDDHAVPNLRQDNENISKKLQKFKEIMKDITKFLAKCYGIPGVVKSPLFIMMIPAIISLAIGWYATLTYQAARAISVGISEADASFLLSLMGIGSLVGRTGHGWFVDRGYISFDTLLVICGCICSAATFLVTLINLYPVLAILAVIQGMTMGIANTLCVVMIKTCAKPNFEESAVGMLYFIWGFGDFIGGVFAGYIYDLTGDYNIAFYFAGSALALSTILIYLTCTLKDRVVNKIFAKWTQQQKEKGRESTVEMISDIPETEEYDNPVFKMEEEDGREEREESSNNEDVGNTWQRSALAQIEIHDSSCSWGMASTLPATVV